MRCGGALKSLLVQKINQILCSPNKLGGKTKQGDQRKRENASLKPFFVEEVKEGETIEIEMNEWTRKNDEKCL